MKIDDVLKWISLQNVALFEYMNKSSTDVDNDDWMEARGAYRVLEKLRLHILAVTNPHNREDLKV